MWIALHAPDSLPKLVRALAWVNGVYGLLYIVALRHLEVYIPGSDVPLFSPPAGQTVAILGLLCFERDLRSVWLVLALNIVVTLAWQVRSEWLGLALGILAWGLLTGRLGRVIAIGMAGLAVLGMVELADIRLLGRNGEAISLSENVGSRHRPDRSRACEETQPERQVSRRHRRVAGALVGADLALRAFHADARGFRAWLRLRPVRPRAGVGPSRPGGLGCPNAAQRLLLRPRLHGMGRGRPVRRSSVRHSSTPLAVLSARRTAGRTRLLGDGHGDGLLRGELRDAVQGDPLLPAGRHGDGAGVAGEGSLGMASCTSTASIGCPAISIRASPPASCLRATAAS